MTGASSGIGAAIADELAGAGYRVFGTGRKASGQRPSGVELVPLDVTLSDSVASCVDEVMRRAGRIDVLVNNAGYLLSGAIEDASLEEARAVFETNFFGIVRMVHAVLPSMRAAGSGKIINMSSLEGMVPVPFWGFYNASKFAVEGYTETLRLELEPLGIRVAMVEPGAIRTPLYAAPHPTGLAVYSPWRERALKTMKGFEDKAPGPELVARVVARLVADAKPALRNRVTREAWLFPLLRWLLPARAFEFGLRAGFNLDKKGY
ncbi:MAG TPA: SDR family NAD(P)-dependent oxidoreductase [Polyangiaceae bacterium]|nr:SDR family NAD(P)-dependent oxidoreductase [Polyangiaceae bacterium]